MLMNKKNKNFVNSSAILLGAGFDMNFGMPGNELLLQQYATFCQNVIDSNIRVGYEKIKMIFESNTFTISRKFFLIRITTLDHIIDKESFAGLELKFFKIKLSLSSYNADNDKLNMLSNFVSAFASSFENDIIITTNFSDVLQYKNVLSVSMQKTSRIAEYIAIHGSLSNAEDNRLYVNEEDFLSEDYDLRKNSLMVAMSNVSKLYLFGYSINDWDVLKTILTSGIESVVIYFYAENELWEDTLNNLYRALFAKHKIKYDSVVSRTYDDIFNKFMLNMTEHYVRSKDPISKIRTLDSNSSNYVENVIKDLNSLKESRIPTTTQKTIDNWSLDKIHMMINLVCDQIRDKYSAKLFLILDSITRRFKIEDGYVDLIHELYIQNKENIKQDKLYLRNICVMKFNLEIIRFNIELFEEFDLVSNFWTSDELFQLFDDITISNQFIFNIISGRKMWFYTPSLQGDRNQGALEKVVQSILKNAKKIPANELLKLSINIIEHPGYWGVRHKNNTLIEFGVRIAQCILIEKGIVKDGTYNIFKKQLTNPEVNSFFNGGKHWVWFLDNKKLVIDLFKDDIIDCEIATSLFLDEYSTEYQIERKRTLSTKTLSSENIFTTGKYKSLESYINNPNALFGFVIDSETVSMYDVKYMFDHIWEKMSNDEIISAIRNRKPNGNIDEVLACIFKKNESVFWDIFFPKLIDYVSISTLYEIERSTNINNVLNYKDVIISIIKSTPIKIHDGIESTYSSSVACQWLEVLLKTTMDDRSYTEASKELLNRVELQGEMNWYINGIKYALLIFCDLPTTDRERDVFITGIIHKISSGNLLNKQEYMDLFVDYFNNSNNKDDVVLLHSVIRYLLDIAFFWKEITIDPTKFIEMIENNKIDLHDFTWQVFEEVFKFQENDFLSKILAAREYFFVEFDKKSVSLASLWEKGYDYQKTNMDLVKKFLIEGKSRIESYDINNVVGFCIDKNLSAEQIAKILLRVINSSNNKKSNEIYVSDDRNWILRFLEMISNDLNLKLQITKHFESENLEIPV